MGDLFKQLFVALGKYLRYHLFGPPKQRDPSTGITATSARTSLQLDSLGVVELDPHYTQTVKWPTRRLDVPADDLTGNELFQLWGKHSGGHKWTHYFRIYEEVFGPRRREPLRILEIGVAQGASLKLWRQYFSHPKTVIVGIDIAPNCAEFDAPASGVHVRIGSQADASFLKTVADEFGPFDLIIDDGSHRSSHIISSFNLLFAGALQESGIYFVEDLHANYWPEWRDSKKSFFDVVRDIIDHMHAHYTRQSPQDFFVLRASDQTAESLDVPLIATWVREIRVFNSIAVIYKNRNEHVPHYLRS